MLFISISDYRLKFYEGIIATVCPRSVDPFYIVGYYMNGLLLLGHIVITLKGIENSNEV